jgi:hypothetical protein
MKEESSEEASPRALGAERCFRGFYKAEGAERVAKPWVRNFLDSRQRIRDAFPKEE